MKKERVFALLFVGSLGLNLFLSGILLRAWSHSFDGRPKAHAGSEGRKLASHSRPGPTKNSPQHQNLARGSVDMVLLRQMVRAMGGRDDPRVKKLQTEHRQQLKAARRDMENARTAARAALVQEPFDAEALKAALSALREHSTRAQAEAQSGMVNLALQMTPQEREELRKHPPLPERKARPRPN